MWLSFTRLTDGLALLRHYVDGFEKRDKLLALNWQACGDAAEVIKDLQVHFRLKNQKRQYDYNTIIISLYGYLERYVEDLITEYLTLLSSYVTTFSELPPAIQTKHLSLSLELARKAEYQRFAGTVKIEEIIARLHTSFDTPEKYQLNVEAFAQHNSNFRQTIVVNTFSQCGIQNVGQSLRHAEPLISFLENEDLDRDVNAYLGGGDDVVFARLNDLADRRNDVAHGTPVGELLSNDILRSYIDFIEAYAGGLALVVYEHLLPFRLPCATFLGPPIAVYNHAIACLNLPSGKIELGDTLIAKTQEAGRPYKGGPIREIQRDNVSIPEIIGGPGVKVGLLVDFGVRDNQEFYYLPKD